MSVPKKLTTRAGLVILCGVVIGLIFLATAAEIAVLKRANDSIAYVRQSTLKKTLIVGNIRSLINRNANITVRLLVDDDLAYLLEQKSSNRDRVTGYFMELETVVESADEKEMITELINHRAAYVKSFGAAGEMIKSGRLSDARSHILSDTLGKLASFEIALDRYAELVEKKLEDRLAAAESGLRETHALVILLATTLSFFVAILMLWLYLRVTRALGGELEDAQAVAHAIAEGRLDQPVMLREGSAGNLMASLERMRLKLRALLDNLNRKNEELATTNSELELKIAERTAALSQRQKKLSKVIGTAIEGYALIDADTYTYKEVNGSLCRMLGYEREEIIGKRPIDFCDAKSAHLFQNKLSNIQSTEERQYEVAMRRKDGTPLYTKYSANTLRDDAGRALEAFAFITDITDIVIARMQLQEAKELAEAASRAKTVFLSSMSHELRTPLNAIIGFAQVLESDPEYPLAERQESCVKHILKAGWHLLELINEVLDLSKIEAGRIELSMEPVAIAHVANECLEMIAPFASKHEVLLKNEAVVTSTVRADRGRLKQALLNLLSNAVKYNRRGGKVVLSARIAGDGRIRIQVADTGKGIEAEQLGQLFIPFNRLVAEDDEIEGTGIGLALTKRLVEQMGGKVGVESKPGEGSVFWLELPQEQGTQQSLPPLSLMENERASPAFPSKSFTLLYVEDNPANAQLVSAIFRRRPDVRLLVAASGNLGLELACAHKPDLILLDINLPGMDGYELKRRLDEDETTAGIPVLALSANAMPNDIEKGRAAGFVDYLTKPIDIRRLEAAVANVLTDAGTTRSRSEPE